ncbi:50S ribosomal protein L18 [Bacilli bacterium]|nr:50S ribosomal protein L18 [Bacilli bacterium]
MKKMNMDRKARRVLRHKRITHTLKASQNTLPRLVVTKTNQHIIAQLIDDQTGKTLAASSSIQLKKTGTVATAKEVGTDIAKKALAKNVTKIVYDRGGNPYHGQIKALADAARAAGLKF